LEVKTGVAAGFGPEQLRQFYTNARNDLPELAISQTGMSYFCAVRTLIIQL